VINEIRESHTTGLGNEAIDITDLSNESSITRKKILLHVCCAPCCSSVVEKLALEYDICLLFFNPNITDFAEYQRRLDAVKDFVERFSARPGLGNALTLVDFEWEPEQFYKAVRGLEKEKEGGKRCSKCFELRLSKSADYAVLHGFELFSTTLSVSPYKDHAEISRIGNMVSLRCGIRFLNEDFKKNDGYKRSVELSKAYGLYRQDFCGCEFSIKRND